MKKRTKALDITKEVRRIVAERDSVEGIPCCVICGMAGIPNAHFIARSQGGKGVEQNIVTLCVDCHRQYDQSQLRGLLRERIRTYLQRKYSDWDEASLYYRKGESE